MAKGFPKDANTKVEADSIKRSNPPAQSKVKTGKDLRSPK